MSVIGSSLGDFYATWLAQQLACKSVLINPSTAPWVTLRRYLGVLSPWNKPDKKFDFRPEYLDELQALDVTHLTTAAPQLMIVARGDEVLDWRDTVRRYSPAVTRVHEGGDHGLSNFAEYLPEIETFPHWQHAHD